MINQKNESGYTLLGVLIIFTIMAFLGLSIVALSFTSVKISHSERDNQSAYYIAEAGLTYKLNKIEEEVADIFSNNIQTEQEFINQLENLNVKEEIYADFEKLNNIEPYASIDVAVIDNNLQITSTGVIDSEKRTVQKEVKAIFNEGEPTEDGNNNRGTGGLPRYGLMIGESLRLTGTNVIYYSDVGLIQGVEVESSVPIYTPTGKVDDPAIDINGNEYDGLPSLPPFPTVPDLPYLNDLSNSDLIVNEIQTIQLDVDGKINTLKIQKGGTLTIQINDTRNLSVNNLDMEEGSSLKVISDNSSELYLHVNNEINISNSEKNKFNYDSSSSVSQFYMFYGGKNKLDFNNVSINGSLYVKDADVNFVNVSIIGNLFSGGEKLELEHSLSGAGGKLLLAPNAILHAPTFHYMGKVIVNSLEITGSLDIHNKECLFGSTNEHLTSHCANPAIKGPISMKAVHDFNSGETEFPGYPGIPGGNQNGSDGESSFEIIELTPVREISR